MRDRLNICRILSRRDMQMEPTIAVTSQSVGFCGAMDDNMHVAYVRRLLRKRIR